MISSFLLLPYYISLKIRNHAYDKGKRKAVSFEDIPVISIGNITVGGTGKTPMTEYLIRMLKEDYKVAVLSRGYKRKSKGFHIVSENDSALEAGDEPLQIKKKFPEVTVAVDKNRVNGVEKLKSLPEEARPDLVILDDGFQYRKLKPTLNIVLQNYYKPIFKDELLPIGSLRDLPSQIRRAQIVVCTKSPDYLDEWERTKMKQLTRTRADQEFLFAKTTYEEPAAVFPETGDKRYVYSKEVFLFTGIANDKPIILQLSDKYEWIAHEKYSDHHKFSSGDLRHIHYFAKRHPRALLLTTEKDAQRLVGCKSMSNLVKSRLFYIPVKTEFLTMEEASRFDTLVRSVLPPARVKPKPEPELKPEPEPKPEPKQQPEKADWTLF